MGTLSTFGERIQEARAGQNLTQKELAKRCGVRQSYISLLERDERSPSKYIIETLARELKCSGGWLLNGSDESALCAEVATIPVAQIQSLIHVARQAGYTQTADKVETWLKESVGSDIPF